MKRVLSVRRSILLLASAVFFSLITIAPGSAQGQDKNILNVSRFFPKIDKVPAFEKALAAHAQKYHSGDFKWRVSEIMSGPDAGGFQVIEGPNNWDEIDKRGNLGAEHQNHFNTTVAIYLTDRYQSMFIEFKPEFSNAELTSFSDKYAITHVFVKPGMMAQASEIIANLKKVWAESGQTVVVYEASASGPNQFSIVTRYKQGLKERQTGFMKPFRERYEAVIGAGSFQKYSEDVQKVTGEVWSELLFTRADLGAK
jgi:hypothetical protein